MLEIERLTIDTVKKVAPAVASIVISKFMPKDRGPLMRPANYGPLNQFPIPLPEQRLDGMQDGLSDLPAHRVKVGGGSGFIVDSDGLVITNKHVVYEPESEYTVITSDEKEYKGTVVSRDPINDVAVLKIDAHELPTVTIGDSDYVELGQTVIAIGNALGLFNNTVSKGIISGLGRKITASLGNEGLVENLRHVIQTDVAINQGNSGGPLVNLDGQVIGINTAIIFGAQNIGFALPINWAKNDLEDLQKYGRIIRPYIGMRYVMLNPELKEQYKLPVDSGALALKDHTPGSEAVIPGSPAYKAGIRENDIIIEMDGRKVTEKDELADFVENKKVGDVIPITYLRNGKQEHTQIKLEERK
jgi:S1-C subfamily serine protease